MATLASPSAPQRKSRTRPVLKKGDMLLRLARQRAPDAIGQRHRSGRRGEWRASGGIRKTTGKQQAR